MPCSEGSYSESRIGTQTQLWEPHDLLSREYRGIRRKSTERTRNIDASPEIPWINFPLEKNSMAEPEVIPGISGQKAMKFLIF